MKTSGIPIYYYSKLKNVHRFIKELLPNEKKKILLLINFVWKIMQIVNEIHKQLKNKIFFSINLIHITYNCLLK